MAKKKTTQYRDRKYNYPKGFTKYGKAKTGFMPASQGAKLFVQANLDKIKKGTIPFDSLTTREKRIYKGKQNNTFVNTYNFEGKSFYDPTGFLRKALDNIPNLKGKRNLTNLLSKKDFKNLFNQKYNPTTGKQNDFNQNKWLQQSSSFYDFKQGDKKKFYRDESGTLMDIATKLTKAENQGRKIVVIDKNGKPKKGVKAIDLLRKFESDELKKLTDKAAPGEKIQLQIVYVSTEWNPFTNTVTYNLNNVQVNNLNQTP